MLSYRIDKIKFQPSLIQPITVTIQYKYYLDENWITVASGISVDTEGVIQSPPVISITGLLVNKIYTVRCLNDICETIYQEDILYPCESSCPDGYTLSADGTFCYRIDTTAATPPSGTPDTLIAATSVSYSTCGSYIYEEGYSSDGTGTSSVISTSNPFWINRNFAASPLPVPCTDNTTADGPLNRAGVWASSTIPNQDIGFAVCVELSETKTYYIGIGVDNYGSVKVDGVTVIMQDETAINAQYGGTGACFKIFHIYPVVLTASPHNIELIGHNVSSAAAVGFEIYDNTEAEIRAATGYGDLNLIFSTKDEVGNLALLGSNGYECPANYSLASCESPLVCQRITTITPVC